LTAVEGRRRKLSAALQEAIEGLALKRPPLSIRVVCNQAKAIGGPLGRRRSAEVALYVLTRDRQTSWAARPRIWTAEKRSPPSSESVACAVAPDARTIIAGDDSGSVHFLWLVEADEAKPAIGDKSRFSKVRSEFDLHVKGMEEADASAKTQIAGGNISPKSTVKAVHELPIRVIEGGTRM
jgi:hypothetical protein